MMCLTFPCSSIKIVQHLLYYYGMSHFFLLSKESVQHIRSPLESELLGLGRPQAGRELKLQPLQSECPVVEI